MNKEQEIEAMLNYLNGKAYIYFLHDKFYANRDYFILPNDVEVDNIGIGKNITIDFKNKTMTLKCCLPSGHDKCEHQHSFIDLPWDTLLTGYDNLCRSVKRISFELEQYETQGERYAAEEIRKNELLQDVFDGRL